MGVFDLFSSRASRMKKHAAEMATPPKQIRRPKPKVKVKMKPAGKPATTIRGVGDAIKRRHKAISNI